MNEDLEVLFYVEMMFEEENKRFQAFIAGCGDLGLTQNSFKNSAEILKQFG